MGVISHGTCRTPARPGCLMDLYTLVGAVPKRGRSIAESHRQNPQPGLETRRRGLPHADPSAKVKAQTDRVKTIN